MTHHHNLPIITERPTWSRANLRPNRTRTWGQPAEYLKNELRTQHTRMRTAFIPGISAFITIVIISATLHTGILGNDTTPLSAQKLFNTLIAGIAAALAATTALGSLKRYNDAKRAHHNLTAGIRGEQHVAATLEQLPGNYHIIHGVDITAQNGGNEDIDHLVIGPSGIIMIDAKNWGGVIEIDEHGLWRDGVHDSSLIEAAKRRAQTLADYLGYSDPIRAIVCFTRPNALPESAHRFGVDFITIKHLIASVRKNEGRLPERVIRELAEDAAILSPSATTTQPYRHSHLAIFPHHLRAYKLRYLTPVLDVLRFALYGVAAIAFLRGSYLIFDGLVEPASLSTLTDGALALALCGAALVTSITLGKTTSKLAFEKVHAIATMIAPRAENRMQRIHPPVTASATASDSDTPLNSPPGDTAQTATARTRDDIEAAFNRELILPATTLEQLVTTQLLLTRSDEYRAEWGQELPYGVILHGPPGTGKTQIARIMASIGGFAFLSAQPSELRDKYVGESAKRIAELYQKARKHAPAVVFLDEIDAIAGSRDGGGGDGATQENAHAINQLLQEIDGFENDPETPVFTIGATNRLDSLDDAVRSRLSYRILVDLPDAEARARMWRLFAKPYLHKVEPEPEEVAALTKGRSGRDLKQIAKLASQTAFARNTDTVTLDMINDALRFVTDTPA